jgi:glucosylceramidase
MRFEAEVIISGKYQSEQWLRKPLDLRGSESAGRNGYRLDPATEYQRIMGFGGAFTEAAAYTLSRMSEENRRRALRRYFDPDDGLAYNIGRIPVHSCDFSLGNYTYIEEGDTSLTSFDLSHEEQWLFPTIRDARDIRGDDIRLLASPWSPPAWMKSNREMNNGGKLLPEYRELWADYLLRYVREMRELGFDLWGLTVQNEPAAVQTWDSCIYSGEEERDFVRDFLGPRAQASGLGDLKILVWDHNRDIIVDRAKAVLSDPEAAKYVWGVGFHWYVSEEFGNVGEVHRLFPDKHLLFTEGCQEGGVHLGSWETGERYARNMIGDFSNWCEGYLDWNLVLDETGGPNHVGNLCDAPIIADTAKDRLIFNSSYYYIGQFSRHISPGALRIGLDSISDGRETLPAVAFRNPDGSLVAVVLNETDEPGTIAITLGGETADLDMEDRSIATIVFRPLGSGP